MSYHVADDGSVVTDKEARASLAAIMQDKEEIDMSKASILERHAYYEEHKHTIIHDSIVMEKSCFLKEWSLPPSTWNGLRKRWLGDITEAQVLILQPRPEKPEATNVRPQLPPWNELWPNEVKLAWLNAYAQVLGK